MPYMLSWRASRIKRAARASVRTGTGPSLAAMPPNSSRVMSAVLAPRSPARSAANTPAGPAPITMTSSNVQLLLCPEIGNPAHSSKSGHEAIFTAPRDDKPMEALKSSANRPAWNREAAFSLARADDWILRIARSKENAVIDPLRLDELELASRMRPDEREH